MMAVENAPTIADTLVAGARSPETPVALICHGSTATEQTITTTLGALGTVIKEQDVRPPAIIVLGDVVGLAATRWG